MKIEVTSKKGLRTSLSIVIDKKTIQNKLNERLIELQSEVNLKGFRPGKVPSNVIKNQFGKAVYGEVIDKILRETSTKAIDEKKINKSFVNICIMCRINVWTGAVENCPPAIELAHPECILGSYQASVPEAGPACALVALLR